MRSSKIPSYVIRWANTIPIDIEDGIRCNLVDFLRLNFLNVDA